MATEPRIVVTEQSVTTAPDTISSGAGNVAVIGAFDSTVTALTLCNNAREAHTSFGTTGTIGDFKGTDSIDGIFTGASSLLVANITTWSNDSTPVASTTLTTEKLEAALAKLHNERFDILFVADELSDAQQIIVSAWLDAEFQAKYCHGQIAQLTKSTASDYTTSVGKFNNNVYYINTQSLTVKGSALNLNMSTAYLVGVIAGLQVNRSLTSKVIDGVSAVSPEYSTATGELGATLLSLNVPFLACRNRRNQTYYCVNSELPDELDIYINRVRDYVLNRLAVEPYLGEINNAVTENGIITIVEGVIEHCVNDLQLLNNITYHVERPSSNCIDIVIDTMVFDDVITEIDIHYSIEVQ